MKQKLKLTILFLFIAFIKVWAQSPNMINYQGVAINTSGIPIANQNIAIRASVHQSTMNGTIIYSEERTIPTDAGGLFNFQLGDAGASATTGSWAAINWDNGNKYLEIEMDPTGGTNFITMGTQQLVSVPYAQYSNKAGALIPTATINANQINQSGATTNQVLKYNGTNWVPGNDVSAFTIPYSATDASSNNSFFITNSNATGGSAIYGMSTSNATSARGVLGNATGTNGVGVYGIASGSNGNGVEGYSNNATGSGVKGTHSANGIAIEGTTGTGYAVYGECTGNSGTAVVGKSNGTSNSAIGVYGESANGTAVKGYGNDANSTAVFGSSLAGTGVKAYSFTGTALDVIGSTKLDGNLKISGGTTNPSAGALLTSDASGNATWKNVKVAFKAGDIFPASSVVSPSVTTKLKYHVQTYDASNNFNLESAATDKSTFIAPVSGLYHFDVRCQLHIASSTTNLGTGRLHLYVNGGSVVNQEYIDPVNEAFHSYLNLRLNEDVHLNAGDKVDVRVYQVNILNSSSCDVFLSYFSGHLVFAD